MNHLKDVGMHEDREYLDVFRLNVMHAVHAKEGQHVATVIGVLKDSGMADRMKRPDTGAPVDTTTALHALDRARQLLHCNKSLLGELYFWVMNYLKGAIEYTEGLVSDNNWPASAAQAIKIDNTRMTAELKEAVENDKDYMSKRYPNQTWGLDIIKFSKNEALQHVSNFRANFMKLKLSAEAIEGLLEDGCSLKVMVDWLRGIHTTYRQHAATDLDIAPNYLLFVQPCYFVATDTSIGVSLNKNSVHQRVGLAWRSEHKASRPMAPDIHRPRLVRPCR